MPEVYRPDPATDYQADNVAMRVRVDTAVATSTTAAERQDTVVQVVANLKAREAEAQEVADSATIPRGAVVADVAHKKDSAKEVRRAIVLLMQMIVKDRAGQVTIDPAVIPDRSKQLLLKLDRKIGNNLSESSAVFLYPLVKAAVDGEIPVDQLEARFNSMKGKVHQSLLRKVSEAIVEQHGDYGATEAEFQQRFDYQTMTGATIRSVDRDDRDRRVPDLTEVQRARYKELRDELDRKIREQVQNDPTIADAEKANESLRRINAMWQQVQQGNEAVIAGVLGDALDAADLIGFHATEVTRVSDPQRLLDEYNITEADMEFFRPEHMLDHFNEYFTTVNGRWVTTEAFQKKLLEGTYSVTNKLLQRVSGNPDLEWDKNFNDMQEGAVMRVIRNRLFALSEDQRILNRLGSDPLASLAFRDAIFRGVMEIDYEIDARRAMHEVRRFIFATDPENVSKFLKGFPASRFAFVMNSYDAPLIELAREEFLRDLEQRIRTNGGQLPPDLFGSYFRADDPRSGSPSPDQRRVRENFMASLERRGKDQDLIRVLQGTPAAGGTPAVEGTNRQLADLLSGPIDTWRIERALALGQAISLVADQRAIEIMVTADPPPGFVGQLPILQYFGRISRAMRGRQDTGGPEPFFDTPVLSLLEIPLSEEQIHHTHRHRHDPRKRWRTVHQRWERNPEQMMQDYVENIIGDVKIGEGLKMKDLLRDFFSFSFLQKGSWRLNAIKEWYKKKHAGVAVDKDWRATYDNLTTEVGVGARWLFDKARAEAEIKHYVMLQKLGSDYETKYPSFFIAAQWDKFSQTDVDRDHQLRLCAIQHGGEKLTIEEFIAEKERTYRGMNFLGLLDRSPYDFMLAMAALDKEIMATKTVGTDTVSAYKYYFDDSLPRTRAQEQERKRYLQVLDRRWGADNIPHIARVMQTWDQLYDYYKSQGGNYVTVVTNPDGSQTTNVKVAEVQKRVYFLMSTAAGNVKMKMRPTMTQEDIGTDPDALRMGAIFLGGPDGLQHYFHHTGTLGQEEDFANTAGHEHHIGDKKFFYTLATRWFDVDQRKILPNTNEMMLEPFFEEVAIVGEDVLSRVWADPKTYFDVASGFTTIDQMLKDEAQGNPKPMDEFMQKITALAANEGYEGMYRLMYIVGFLRMKFMQEHHNARDLHLRVGPIPLPSPLVGNPFLDRKNLAYSTLYTDRNAKTMSPEEIRQTIHQWVEKRWLPKTGKYSSEWLEKALRVDSTTYMKEDVIPSAITLLLLIYFLTQIRQAYESEIQPQKKAA